MRRKKKLKKTKSKNKIRLKNHPVTGGFCFKFIGGGAGRETRPAPSFPSLAADGSLPRPWVGVDGPPEEGDTDDGDVENTHHQVAFGQLPVNGGEGRHSNRQSGDDDGQDRGQGRSPRVVAGRKLRPRRWGRPGRRHRGPAPFCWPSTPRSGRVGIGRHHVLTRGRVEQSFSGFFLSLILSQCSSPPWENNVPEYTLHLQICQGLTQKLLWPNIG